MSGQKRSYKGWVFNVSGCVMPLIENQVFEKLQGSMIYNDEDYKLAIQYISEKKLNLKQLIIQRFDFKDYNVAHDFIEKNAAQTLKILIDVN